MLKIGFIGFGEAAYQICLGLSGKKNINIYTYDVLFFDKGKKQLLEEKASSCGVHGCNSLADLADKTEIIFSAVTSTVALKVAEEISPYLKNEHIFVDLNAITPATSKKIASIVEGTGAYYIDGAMMGALRTEKHEVPMLISGVGADLLLSKVEPLGFNMTLVGEQPGKASGVKLIRSLFMKGFAVLLIETLISAKKLDSYDMVLNSIESSLKKDPAILIKGLVSGTVLHSERRLSELLGSKKMLEEAGIDSFMIDAVIEVFKRMNDINLNKENIGGEVESTIEMLSSNY